jgi:hypothetical protein
MSVAETIPNSLSETRRQCLSNVTDMGVSFGGSCLSESSVGTTSGFGTFTINSFAVS